MPSRPGSEGFLPLPVLMPSSLLLVILSVVCSARALCLPALADDLSKPCDTSLFKGLALLTSFLNGAIARTLAVLAVMGFGIGALSGRTDWIKALQVILAIGVIFTASTLVDSFIPSGTTKCTAEGYPVGAVLA